MEEFFRRHGSFPEAQMFSGHKNPAQLARYGQMMKNVEAADTLVEIQMPPLYHTHGITTVRELHQRLLDAAQAIDQLQEEKQQKEEQLKQEKHRSEEQQHRSEERHNQQSVLIAEQFSLLRCAMQYFHVPTSAAFKTQV